MKRKNKYSSLEKKIRIKGRGNAPGPQVYSRTGMDSGKWKRARTHSPQYPADGQPCHEPPPSAFNPAISRLLPLASPAMGRRIPLAYPTMGRRITLANPAIGRSFLPAYPTISSLLQLASPAMGRRNLHSTLP
jgi:hypothetical protein